MNSQRHLVVKWWSSVKVQEEQQKQFSNLKDREKTSRSKIVHSTYLYVIVLQTSRFPYIGSWCVLFAMLTQYVMAAAMLSNIAFILCIQVCLHTFVYHDWVAFPSGSPSYIFVKMCWSHWVCPIVFVICCRLYQFCTYLPYLSSRSRVQSVKPVNCVKYSMTHGCECIIIPNTNALYISKWFLKNCIFVW